MVKSIKLISSTVYSASVNSFIYYSLYNTVSKTDYTKSAWIYLDRYLLKSVKEFSILLWWERCISSLAQTMKL